LYRKKYTDSIGYLETAFHSSVRELYRSSFIDIAETYDVWYPNYWDQSTAALGALVDTFDAVDNKTPGWEEYNITEVVKDSLLSDRKKAAFILKLRDEFKSYSRLVDYQTDLDNTTMIDTATLDPQYCDYTKFPYVQVVYGPGVSVVKRRITLNNTSSGLIAIYSVSGRLLQSVNVPSGTEYLQVLKNLGYSSGAYIVQNMRGNVKTVSKIVL